MVFSGTFLSVFDNSGGRLVQCIRVLNVGLRKYGKAGDFVVLTLKSINPRKRLKKGQLVKGVVVSTVKPVIRSGGEQVRFDKNAVVLVNDKKLPLGTRVLMPVMLEVRMRGYMKVVSLSKRTI